MNKPSLEKLYAESTLEQIEPERYELYAPPFYLFNIERRDFFKSLAGGVFIALFVKDIKAQNAQSRQLPPSIFERENNFPRDISAWLHISEDGSITAHSGKAEVGQNTRTSLSQAVAEELRVPVSSIKFTMSDTDVVPYDAGTFGSRSTTFMMPKLRKAAAAARELLIDLAAKELQVDRKTLEAKDGIIIHTQSNRQLTYSQLTKGKNLVGTLADDIPLTPADQWKVLGQPVPKVNAYDIVTGKHKYTTDIKLPGMLYGKILRPPAFGATLESVNTEAAEKIPGVTIVKDSNFVGAVASDSDTAAKAIGVITTKWKTTPQIQGKDLFEHLKKNADAKSANSPNLPGPVNADAEAVTKAVAEADYKTEAAFTIPYIAHAPMEPRAAVADWKSDKLTVWTGTQRPFGVRTELVDAFHLLEDRVRVIVPDTGSGYGGKHTGDAALEAARLSKAVGKPVKVVWTREEEFTWAYFRPAGVIDIKAGVNKDGIVTGWDFHNYNSGSASLKTNYSFQFQRCEFHTTQSPLRIGSYRALASVANHFAREVYMDELANLVKMDSLEFRLKNLKDERMRAVLETVAKKFEWGKTKPKKDHGFGIACGFEKGGYVANCVEVSVDRTKKKVSVVRIVTAFECGAITNPVGLKNQVDGSLIQAIGGALIESIQFDQGKILNPHFSSYKVPRFSDIPPLETILINRKDIPSAGGSEAPMIALAPAIGNAIFNAIGERFRSLPMKLS